MPVGDIAVLIAQIVLGAAAGEALIEFILAPAWDWLAEKVHCDEGARQIILRLLSCGLGIAIASNYSLDVFALLGMTGHWGEFGVILTGALLGRGSNWLHEFIKRFVLGNVQKQAEADMALRAAEAAWGAGKCA